MRSMILVFVLAAAVVVTSCGDDAQHSPDAACCDGDAAGLDGGDAAGADGGDAAGADAGDDAGLDADLDAGPDAGDDAGTPPPPVRVLFIGNSYTAANSLVSLVADMALTAGLDPPLETAQVTVGGARLSDHLANAVTVGLIHSGGWDFVVLQGQSVEALYDPPGFHAGAAGLALEITTAGAVPVFFETWARVEGHAVYQEVWSGGSPAAMQAGLRDAYGLAATNAGGQVAPVGDAWELVLGTLPTLTLHSGDGSHPSIHGTYLAACVFYLRLTGAPLADTGAVPAAITSADATALRQAADQTLASP